MSVVVKDAHGLKAYYHDCLMSEEDRIDENGEPVNYVYAKLKADKVITHQKYKRCLAMAWWCSAELGMLVSTWESKIKHYKKWQKRWLKLAKEFKEAK